MAFAMLLFFPVFLRFWFALHSGRPSWRWADPGMRVCGYVGGSPMSHARCFGRMQSRKRCRDCARVVLCILGCRCCHFYLSHVECKRGLDVETALWYSSVSDDMYVSVVVFGFLYSPHQSQVLRRVLIIKAISLFFSDVFPSKCGPVLGW